MIGSPARLGDEAGFIMVEVIVSAVILVILALATLSLVDQSGQSSAASRSRGIATAIAQADQDTLRQAPIADLNSHHVTTNVVGADGITYKLVSSADWVRDATGLVTCTSNTARTEYAEVTSTVTWPLMNGIKPVVLQSYVSPGVAALTNGALTVKLTGDTGVGTSAINVTGGGQSGLTDINGCVVFNNLAQGSAATEWNAPGYVNRNGVQDVTGTSTIATAQTSQLNDLYDKAGSVAVNFFDDSTPAVATPWKSVTFVNTGMTGTTPVGQRTYTSATAVNTITADKLFPFASAYSIFAGNCAGNNPASYTGGTLTSSQIVAPGASLGYALPLPSVSLTVAGVPATGARAYAYPASTDAAMTGCSATAADRVGPVAVPAGTSTTKFPLPYGVWRLCIDTTTAGVSYHANTLSAVSGTNPLNPAVNTQATVTGTYAKSAARNLTTAPYVAGLCPTS